MSHTPCSIHSKQLFPTQALASTTAVLTLFTSTARPCASPAHPSASCNQNQAISGVYCSVSTAYTLHARSTTSTALPCVSWPRAEVSLAPEPTLQRNHDENAVISSLLLECVANLRRPAACRAAGGASVPGAVTSISAGAR